MIREEKFRISRKPYAVDLGSLRVRTTEPDPAKNRHVRLHHVTINAAWFRRRRGVTVACIGTLWDYQRDPKPLDVQEALARHDDGRYGGSCHARWDGESYWNASIGEARPEDIERHLTLLRPMLENYPAIPPGHDGWWRF